MTTLPSRRRQVPDTQRQVPGARYRVASLGTWYSVLGALLGLAALAIVVLLTGDTASSQSQPQFGHAAFKALWDRTDGPVASQTVKRSWVWGPVPGRVLTEQFTGLPGNNHMVQYFDKGRMEINNPNGNPSDPFFVTNGLLAVELISGNMQTGLNSFESRGPADINVAADADDRSAPTYRSFRAVANFPGAPGDRRKSSQVGQAVRSAIDRQGTVQVWPQDHLDYGVKIAYFEPATGHNIADVFWTYLNEKGPIIQNGKAVNGPLFYPWFSVTGYPISEPYWSYVKVEGKYTDVLMQAFERRVLTYVPHLPSPFKVQMGNIGQHYYEWRYLRPTNVPTPAGRPAVPNVQIQSIQYRKSITDINGTYVVLVNQGQTVQALDGWRLDSPKWDHTDRFYLPRNTNMAPGATLRVHSGPGVNSVTDIYMYRTSVMWDQQTYDLAILYDSSGREVSRLFPASGKPTPPPGPQATSTPGGSVPTATPTKGTPGPTATRGGVPSAVPTGVTTVVASPSPTGSPVRTGTPGTGTATPTPTGGPSGGCPSVPDSKKSPTEHTGDVYIDYVETDDTTEYVELYNEGDNDVDISGWTVRNKNDHSVSFTFPSGASVASDDYEGVTTSVEYKYSFNSPTPLWDECGAALELLDANNQVVSRFAYGTYLIP